MITGRRPCAHPEEALKRPHAAIKLHQQQLRPAFELSFLLAKALKRDFRTWDMSQVTICPKSTSPEVALAVWV